MRIAEEIADVYWIRGLTTRQGARVLKISPTHFKRLMNRYGIPFRSIAAQKSHPKSVDLSLQPALGYILGVLHGDAWISRGYEMRLCSKDKEFCDAVATTLCEIGLHGHVWCDPRGYWQMLCRSVLLARWFNSLQWVQIEDIARQFPIEFVRGIYDSEGSIHLNRARWPVLQVTTTNHTLANLFCELSPTPWFHRHYPGSKAHYKIRCALAISRRCYVDTFLDTVNPRITRKTRVSMLIPCQAVLSVGVGRTGVRRDCTGWSLPKPEGRETVHSPRKPGGKCKG